MDKNIFFQKYKLIIQLLLERADVKVACLEEDPDVALGYCVSRGHCLDWIFVKKAWRRLGIAKALVSPDINRCSHLTKLGRTLKPKEWIFDPFL